MNVPKLGILAVLWATLLLYGCSGMSYTQQRMLSGGAIGAASGAVIGAATGGSAATGAAIGGAAGVVGGVIVDQYEKSQGRY
ncbi:MAG: YMGG-like glycine zipper-containing protein [Syntrophobacteraceae bacterium]|nr:YMGG-like glycine zipper-containing protein [Syntrophobacteraceae bacterium]MCU0587505.1 YMGG-like glycine zipper-containing protein [Syntrophobacteraceae bacterium]